LKGDYRFWTYIYDRIEGKIPLELLAPEVDLEAIRDHLKRLRAERNGQRAEEDEHEHT
jgi:hypothetical protein